ncbi:hypothetical protein ACE41H_22435 [Paenibacillus enshidis]|uniref:Dipeptidylpeptidase IV N-terminal domain-containing protein n=1 Tax=Paenibacillus enshidis TaxID=1458439 RepID=A0ABV5AZ75_9BACL
MKYVAAFLMSVIIVGSNSNLSSAAADNHNAKSVQNSSAMPSYQIITKFEKNVSRHQIIWREKGVTLTANRIKIEDAIPIEANIITSMVVTNGDKKYTISTADFEDKFRDVTSASLSSSNTWLAIQVKRSSGESLVLVNLRTGEFSILNDRLLAEGKKNVETVADYNWSPKADQIAFSFGDPSKNSIAIYDTRKNSILYLPRETNYISTSVILWHKNGQYFDYICESPSDQSILYRYSLEDNKVKPVKKISKNELQRWTKLDK